MQSRTGGWQSRTGGWPNTRIRTRRPPRIPCTTRNAMPSGGGWQKRGDAARAVERGTAAAAARKGDLNRKGARQAGAGGLRRGTRARPTATCPQGGCACACTGAKTAGADTSRTRPRSQGLQTTFQTGIAGASRRSRTSWSAGSAGGAARPAPLLPPPAARHVVRPGGPGVHTGIPCQEAD